MIKRHGSPSKSAIAAALVAVVLAVGVVSPAAADKGKARGGKDQKTTYRSQRDDRSRDDRGRKEQKTTYRSKRDDRSQRDYRNPREARPRVQSGKWHSRPGERPDRVWKHRSARKHPIWADRRTRIYQHDHRPFYFHTGFDVFFGGDAFWLNVGNVPPHGYVYYDPHCHMPFHTVSAYRLHLHRHHHPALIDVIVADDVSYCDHYAYYGEPVGGYGECGTWDY